MKWMLFRVSGLGEIYTYQQQMNSLEENELDGKRDIKTAIAIK